MLIKGSKKYQGCTLIELLVVIAIIAILVAIVIVAIDPVQRLRDTQDRAAASNVRSAGTLLAVCVTKSLETDPTVDPFVACDNDPDTELTPFGNLPRDVRVEDIPAGDLCAVQQGSPGLIVGNYFVYTFSDGEVDERGGEIPAVIADWCP